MQRGELPLEIVDLGLSVIASGETGIDCTELIDDAGHLGFRIGFRLLGGD